MNLTILECKVTNYTTPFPPRVVHTNLTILEFKGSIIGNFKKCD